MDEIEKLKEDLKESEAARSYIGKKLAAAQKELHEVKSELSKYRRAKKSGRVVILPEVSEKDRKLFVDGLHDYFLEAKLYDPSVGIFGMTDGETALADALMEALEEKDGDA